jgi:hypothetical protein
MSVKKFIGSGFKIVIAFVVIAFLGLRSLDFFYFVTPADQFYYAYLGFGLTGGGVIAYLIIFLWDADTPLKKSISIAMLAFCVVGELASAGFGLQINAWRSAGYQMANEDFKAMILVIQLLGFVHAAALIGYVAGDPIMQAFGDEDGDGTPNFLDADYKPAPKQNKGSTFRFPWSKKTAPTPAPEPVRQFSAEEMQAILAFMAEYKVGQPVNGNGAADPTKASPR